jgi:hypothetical protein
MHDDREFLPVRSGTTRRAAVASGFSRRSDGLDLAAFASVHTLGPESTSSHLAARHFMAAMSLELAIVLHDKFEDILNGDRQVRGRLVIVPSAFAGAHKFFMAEDIELIGCFCHDTPPYHVAWRRGAGTLRDGVDPERSCAMPLIASHPAPVDLIPRILPAGSRFRVAHYCSTVAAARAVLVNDADMALCNLSTIAEFGLESSGVGIVIQMTWNVFAQGGPAA